LAPTTLPANRRKRPAQAGALQSAIFKSANFSSIATDAQGVIQIFNVGAERMLGYTAAEVMTRSRGDISDPQEVIARAKALSVDSAPRSRPASRPCVQGSRHRGHLRTDLHPQGWQPIPAIVSVTALRDAHGAIIGYLLIGTDKHCPQTD